MTTATATPSKSIGIGDIVAIGKTINDNRAALAGIVALLRSLFGGLFGHKAKPAPTVPVTVPTPTEDGDPKFPDDTIPTPAPPTRTVVNVVLRLARVQYSKARFPDMYTDDNPMGLMDDATRKDIEGGNEAMPWGSKFWLDLTAYDADNQEFTRDRVLAHGLSFRTEHHCGEAHIIGHGADAAGDPIAGYETVSTDQIGNGDAAWRSSLGFLHQLKSHVDANGSAFLCKGAVGGVSSNAFTIRIN
jgi:hypothetical protein